MTLAQIVIDTNVVFCPKCTLRRVKPSMLARDAKCPALTARRLDIRCAVRLAAAREKIDDINRDGRSPVQVIDQMLMEAAQAMQAFDGYRYSSVTHPGPT